MMHNHSTLIFETKETLIDCVFDIPGLGLSRLSDWLDREFTLIDMRHGRCVSVRSSSVGGDTKVELGIRTADGGLVFAPIGTATLRTRS